MQHQGVWKKVRRAMVPKNQRCIKCKWVFKIKRDGTFRASLVACGYSQVLGVDYTENYVPVINNVMWHILLIAMLVWNLDAIIIDVESTLLYDDLDEEIYMELPDGMMGFEDKCLLLLKAIYGLVQAVQQWHKKLIDVLKKIGFMGGIADPCLMMHQNNLGVNLMSIYVDDNFCVGKQEALKKLVRDLEAEGLSAVKVSWDLKDYLSCTIAISNDKKRAWIGQPHLIKKLEERFGYLVNERV